MGNTAAAVCECHLRVIFLYVAEDVLAAAGVHVGAVFVAIAINTHPVPRG